MCVFETFDSFDYPSFHHSFSLLFSPSQSCRCTPELRMAQTWVFCSFLVKTSISSLTGYSRLAMRMDSWRAQAKQFESGDAARHLCDRGTSSRTCLMDSRRWNRKAKPRKEKKPTLCWSQFVCDFYIINKDKFSLHLQVLAKPLVDDITTRLSCGQPHALLMRRLLSSHGSFLLLRADAQPSATIKGFHTTLMKKKNCQKSDTEPKFIYIKSERTKRCVCR